MGKEKLLTLGIIRDYILKNFPDLYWWDGIHKHEKFTSDRNYKHREGMPNEIRIEFDGESKDKNWVSTNSVAIKLWKLGYSFAIFYVEGGRSPHIHIYDLDELDTLNKEQREKYRILFLQKLCPKNKDIDLELCKEKHLCALEFANHFKYNKPKKLLFYFWQGMNMGIDTKLKSKVLGNKKSKKKKFDYKNLKLGDQLKMGKRTLILKKLNFETVFDKYGIEFRGSMALCPFHNDTNRSLSFTNEKGLWKCWGCGEKGDIITLIKLLEDKK